MYDAKGFIVIKLSLVKVLTRWRIVGTPSAVEASSDLRALP